MYQPNFVIVKESPEMKLLKHQEAMSKLQLKKAAVTFGVILVNVVCYVAVVVMSQDGK